MAAAPIRGAATRPDRRLAGDGVRARDAKPSLSRLIVPRHRRLRPRLRRAPQLNPEIDPGAEFDRRCLAQAHIRRRVWQVACRGNRPDAPALHRPRPSTSSDCAGLKEGTKAGRPSPLPILLARALWCTSGGGYNPYGYLCQGFRARLPLDLVY